MATTLVGINIAVVTDTTVIAALTIQLVRQYGELAAVVLAASADQGDIEPGELTIIGRLFDFSETTAAQMMAPLIDVAVNERHSTRSQAARMAAESDHVGLPVFDGRGVRVDSVLILLGCKIPLGNYTTLAGFSTWQTDGNARHRGTNWRFTTADARNKLKSLYPTSDIER